MLRKKLETLSMKLDSLSQNERDLEDLRVRLKEEGEKTKSKK